MRLILFTIIILRFSSALASDGRGGVSRCRPDGACWSVVSQRSFIGDANVMVFEDSQFDILENGIAKLSVKSPNVFVELKSNTLILRDTDQKKCRQMFVDLETLKTICS